MHKGIFNRGPAIFSFFLSLSRKVEKVKFNVTASLDDITH